MTPETADPTSWREPNRFQAGARRLLFARLADLSWGRLSLRENGAEYPIGNQDADGPRGIIEVRDPRFYSRVLTGGTVGAGEAYMAGFWDSPDLTAVIRIMARNLSLTNAMEQGWARPATLLLKPLHWLRRNDRSGSRRNIAAHYDLGNPFFGSFLDPLMMYSSAVFPEATASLARAARYKLDHVCQKLALQPGDRVLEIGSGWGGFALHAAHHYGCHVTTTTLSRRQFAYVSQRIADEKLGDRIRLLQQDYRDLRGRFDKLVSIEMIEAVGHRYLNTYFKICSDLLEPDGRMLLQAITIPEYRYAQALREVDFIKRYIFPGSFIPSMGAMLGALAARTDLSLSHVEDLTPHYARTLAAWRRNFIENPEPMDRATRRMWLFYFSYCEGAFHERVIGSNQLVFSKPLNRSEPLLHPFPALETPRSARGA